MTSFDPPRPLRRVSAVEAAFAALQEIILSDDISIGDRLPGEIELARRFGVSRAILREALGACATLGLTETRTGSGTFVVSKHPQPQLSFGGYSARDLIEARLHVEVPAAGYAATRATEAQRQELRELVDLMQVTENIHAWVELDGRLHRAIAEASGNPVISSMVGMMREALDPQSEFLNITRARQSLSDEEHLEIVAAVIAGSSEDAMAAAARHVEQVAAAVAAAANEDPLISR